MEDLSSYDLKEQSCVGMHAGEERIELRVASTNDFVAWFQVNNRASDNDVVTGMNLQLMRRAALSDAQTDRARAWLAHKIAGVL